MNKQKISIVLPCLNEEKSIGICLEEIINVIKTGSLNAEIIVVDNDSSDRTHEIVSSYLQSTPNLKLVQEKNKGYGSAYLCGFNAATGEQIFMADADFSYNFNDIPKFISKLEEGYDLVVGNRFSGKMNKGVMPPLHKYIGNPILSLITRMFFGIKIKDIHCGARAFSKSILSKINLQTMGMEFASEMIIKSSKSKLKIAELPIVYRPRIGESKLNSFSDGWRHLRFILLYSPLVIFLIPGIFFMLFGTVLLFFLKNTDVNSIFLSSSMIILGYQFIFFAVFARIYAITHLRDEDTLFKKLFELITIERAGGLGIFIGASGVLLYICIVQKNLENNIVEWLHLTKILSTSITVSVLGIQTIASAFMLSILGIKER